MVRQKPVKNCVKEPQEKCKTVYEEVCENYEEKCSSPVYEEKCENIQEEKCEPVTLTECKAEPIQVTKIMKGHKEIMYNYFLFHCFSNCLILNILSFYRNAKQRE